MSPQLLPIDTHYTHTILYANLSSCCFSYKRFFFCFQSSFLDPRGEREERRERGRDRLVLISLHEPAFLLLLLSSCGNVSLSLSPVPSLFFFFTVLFLFLSPLRETSPLSFFLASMGRMQKSQWKVFLLLLLFCSDQETMRFFFFFFSAHAKCRRREKTLLRKGSQRTL